MSINDHTITRPNIIFNIFYTNIHKCLVLIQTHFTKKDGKGAMCTTEHIFFFFHWHYSPLWALACWTMSFHFFLSATNSLHLLTPSTWRSLSTSSFLGLPLLLIPSSSWVKIFLGILSSSILSRWPNQLILCPFIHFIIFSPLLISTRVHIVYICIPCPLAFWKFLLALNSICEHNISTNLVPTVTAFQDVDGATSTVCHVCFV